MNKRERIIAEMEQIGMRRGMYCRAASIATRAAAPEGDKKPDSYRWILATEMPVEMLDWDRCEIWPEVLLADGMVAPVQVPLFDSHRRSSIDFILGSVSDFKTVKIEEVNANEGVVKLSSTAEKASVLIDENHLTDGSVGYIDEDSIFIPENTTIVYLGKDYVGPVKLVTRWRLIEFSLTTVGADSLAKIKRILREV